MLARLLLLFAFAMFLTSGVLRVAKPAPPAGGLLVVANQKEHTLLLVDPENRRELAKIVVGVNGHEVMASKDGRIARNSGRTGCSTSRRSWRTPSTSSILPHAGSLRKFLLASRSLTCWFYQATASAVTP